MSTLPRGTVLGFSHKVLALSKIQPLFGVYMLTILLLHRRKTLQCDKCFVWHYERAYSHLPRCRIYSSIKHVEGWRISSDPNSDYQCPTKGANCFGPHGASSLESLIQPEDNKLHLQTNMIETRQAAAAAGKRLKAAHCETIKSKNNTETMTNTNPSKVRPQHPNNMRDLLAGSSSMTGGKYAILVPNGHEDNTATMNLN